jgi:hypothetical protein
MAREETLTSDSVARADGVQATFSWSLTITDLRGVNLSGVWLIAAIRQPLAVRP